MLSRREVVVLTLLFIASLPAVTARIYASDEVQYFAFLRSFWFDGDVSFENEYRYFYDRGIAHSVGFYDTHLERVTETGRRINFGTIGAAILWAPFYAAGDVTARLLHAADRDVALDGYSKPYIAAVCYGSAFYGFCALLLSMAAARRLGFAPLAATMAIWAGTPFLFYMYVAPPMAHACSAFAVSLVLWIWLRIRDTWPTDGVAALGAAGALMAMVREQDALLLCGPAVDFALFAWRRVEAEPWPRAIRVLAVRALAAAGTFAIAYAPQAFVYIRLNGHLGPSRLVIRKMSWSAPHALQVLFSPEHGFFIWTPVAALAMAGLVWMTLAPRRQDAVRRPWRAVGACLLLMIAMQVYSAGSVESWTVAGAFGQRRFVAVTPLLVVGLSALAHSVAARRTRSVLAVVAVVAVYWNLALIAEFATGLMDRQRLDPPRNAYDAFVTIPRMAPDLAYRYLFRRASFYQTKTPR
jgi:hypothetical protein